MQTSRRGFFGLIAGAVAAATAKLSAAPALPTVTVASVWEPFTPPQFVEYGYSNMITDGREWTDYRPTFYSPKGTVMQTTSTMPQLNTGKKKGSKKGPGGRSC
jgi:hypothetical protein